MKLKLIILALSILPGLASCTLLHQAQSKEHDEVYFIKKDIVHPKETEENNED